MDLKKEKGKEVLKRLVKNADVLVEGFRPGVMDKLGVGYDALKSINPGLIYCAITGYGLNGPYRDRAGHEINYLALAGFLGLNVTKEGEPIVPGVQMADVAAGSLMAVIGILAALHHKNRTGEGQMVDISMCDGAMALIPLQNAILLATGKEPRSYGEMMNGALACYNIYQTADGRVMTLGALEKKFWDAFCDTIGKEELKDRHMVEGEEQEQTKKQIDQIFREKTQSEWVDFFREPHGDFTLRRLELGNITTKFSGKLDSLMKRLLHWLKTKSFSSLVVIPWGRFN